jgi:hypothetical protein
MPRVRVGEHGARVVALEALAELDPQARLPAAGGRPGDQRLEDRPVVLGGHEAGASHGGDIVGEPSDRLEHA